MLCVWGRGWRESFCLVLPLSTLPLGRCGVGCFPHLPHSCSAFPGLWVKLLVTGSSSRWMDVFTHLLF